MFSLDHFWVRIVFGVFGVGLMMLVFPKIVNKEANTFHLSQIGLEWAGTQVEMEREFQRSGGNSKKLLVELLTDSFPFIPIYVALFSILAFHIREKLQTGLALYLFYIILVCILIAAIADWTENYLIWKTVFPPENETLLGFKVFACAMKWGLIAVATGLVSLGFLSMGNVWVALPGFITAGVLMVGVIGPHPLIQWGFGMLGILLIICAFRPI